jgi:hypothetical protein
MSYTIWLIRMLFDGAERHRLLAVLACATPKQMVRDIAKREIVI